MKESDSSSVMRQTLALESLFTDAPVRKKHTRQLCQNNK